MTCAHLSACKRDKAVFLVQRGMSLLDAVCAIQDEARTRATPPLCLLNVEPSQDRGAFFDEDRPAPEAFEDRDEKPEEPEEEEVEEDEP